MQRYLLIGVLCVAVTASATTMTGLYRTHGFLAHTSCGVAVKDRHVRHQIPPYVAGFLTGFNRGNYRTYSLPPDDALKAEDWIVAYCQTHPAVDFIEAVEEYVLAVYPQRGQTHTNTVSYSQAQNFFACDP